MSLSGVTQAGTWLVADNLMGGGVAAEAGTITASAMAAKVAMNSLAARETGAHNEKITTSAPTCLRLVFEESLRT